MPEERGSLGNSWAFTKSLVSGAWNAGAAVVEGVGELAKGGYALATDEKAREAAWNTTKKLAKAAGNYGEEVWDDPAKAYRDAREGTLAAYNRFEQAKEKAAAEGRLAEFWGELAGQGAVELGSLLIPVGVVAKLVKVRSAGRRARAVVNDPVVDLEDSPTSPVEECPLNGCEPNPNYSLTVGAAIIPRTKKAAEEANKIIQIMKEKQFGKKNPTIMVYTHKDGTVSVGLSGPPGEKFSEKMDRLQKVLDEDPNTTYTVSTKSIPVEALNDIEDGNTRGNCAEPKVAYIASQNTSPITGSSVKWRGREGQNNHPHTLGDNEMNPCLTCADPHNIKVYEDIATANKN